MGFLDLNAWHDLSWKGFLYSAGGAFITSWLFTPEAYTSGLRYFLIGYGWNYLIWITQWYGNRLVGHYVEQRTSWEENPKRKAIVIALSCVLYSLIAFALVQLTMLVLVVGLNPWEALRGFFGLSIWITVGISLSLSLLYLTLNFYRDWTESKLEAEALRTEMMSYKYEALRNQLNPHFLFNTLANLSALIRKDPPLAEAYVSKLSNIFRYVLEIQDKEIISMAEELDFAKQYAFLLESRAQGAVRFNFEDIRSGEDEYLLPMSIQTLLENIAKHNTISADQPLEAHVRREGQYLSVTNPIRPKTYKTESTKVGLYNLKSRYEYLQQGNLEIMEGEGQFTVRLPIIKKNTT